MEAIIEKLDELVTLKIRRTALVEPFQAQIMALEVERDFEAGEMDDRIVILENEIKASVKDRGESVKGTFLRAIFNRGRVSWNTKGLVGYSVANPEILAFRKQGRPYVSLRGL